MSEAGGSTAVKFQGLSACFLVDDVVQSAEYYRDVLGFHFHRYWGEPPCFVMVGRDSVWFFLSSVGPAGLVRPNRKAHPNVTWDAYVYVNDAEALCQEWRARGTKILREPGKTFYKNEGVRDREVQRVGSVFRAGYLGWLGPGRNSGHSDAAWRRAPQWRCGRMLRGVDALRFFPAGPESSIAAPAQSGFPSE